MTELGQLLNKVKKTLIPSEDSEIPQELVAEIQEALPQEVEVVIGGSWAKDTYLPGDHDIDVFVRFPTRYDDDKMVAVLDEVLKKHKPLRVKGSRDYFQLNYKGFDFELVPVLKVTGIEEARNVTDMSPLHVDYVRAAVAKKPGLNNEIRLAKQFAKAQGVYGAESYLMGLSGHVIDLLIIFYGGFLALLDDVKNWSGQTFIDLTGKHMSPDFLNEAKRDGPLVVVDPVQKDRNAAAALQDHKCELFKQAAKAFLANPTEEAFIIKKMTVEKIKKRHPRSLIYELTAVQGTSKDIAGTKCYKAHHHFLDMALRKGFVLQADGFSFDGKVALCFAEASNEPLSKSYIHHGPPVQAKEDAKKFKAKYAKSYETNGILYVELEREYRTLKELFQKVAAEEYFSTRTTQTKLL